MSEITDAADVVGGRGIEGEDVEACMLVGDERVHEEGLEVFSGDARQQVAPRTSVLVVPTLEAWDSGGGGNGHFQTA